MSFDPNPHFVPKKLSRICDTIFNLSGIANKHETLWAEMDAAGSRTPRDRHRGDGWLVIVTKLV